MNTLDPTGWNNQGHIDRVTAPGYIRETRDIIAPRIAKEIGRNAQSHEPGSKIIHDIGGYNGLLLQILLANHLDPSWQGLVTDITKPPELVSDGIEFYQVASSGIAQALNGRKADATISCSTFHVIDNDEMAKTVQAVKETTQSGAPFVSVNLHPVTHRRMWSDFAGRDEPLPTDKRGVFIDEYTNDTVIPHGFVGGTDSYPRTVEDHVSMFLDEGLQLNHIEAVHLPDDYAHVGRGFDERYREALAFLPSFLLTSWSLP